MLPPPSISLVLRLPAVSPFPSSPSTKFPSSSLSSPCFVGLSLRGHGPPGRRLAKAAVDVTCVSSRSARKGPVRRSDGGLSEAQELVRSLLRKTSEGKQPLVPTLNKFVRVLRTEHCFLIFEELGKKDRWLQCLEVCPLSEPFYFCSLADNYLLEKSLIRIVAAFGILFFIVLFCEKLAAISLVNDVGKTPPTFSPQHIFSQ